VEWGVAVRGLPWVGEGVVVMVGMVVMVVVAPPAANHSLAPPHQASGAGSRHVFF
jgi:hypothetical protein